MLYSPASQPIQGSCLPDFGRYNQFCDMRSATAASQLAAALLRSEAAEIELLLPSLAAHAVDQLHGDFSPLPWAIAAHGVRLGGIAAVREALLGESTAKRLCCCPSQTQS